MSKSTVTRIFVGSLISIIAGVVLLLIAGGFGFAGTQFIMSGPDIVGVQPSSATWVAGSMGAIAILALIAGGVGQLVAWIGALVNTAQIADKTWFILLLVLGVLGLGFIPMVVYVLAGPDGTALAAPARQPSSTTPPTELSKAA
jgi:hypothetical protein